jgi:hypothetical protein
MTLDEAIRHAEEVAEDAKLISIMVDISHITELEQKKCANEHKQLAEWLQELKKLREATTNTDTISRQAAIDALGEAPEVWTDSPEEFAALNQWKMDMAAIKAVPSTDRPQGKWIETDRTYFGATVFKCSVCCDEIDEMPTVMGVPKYKYCPYCGIKMKGADDE